MKENKISVEIDRPVADVFEFTINPRNTHLWIDSVIREEANEFPIKLGTEYRNVNAKGEWSEYNVVQFAQNKIFEMSQKNSSYHVRYSYENLSNNKTRLTYFEWVDNGEIQGPFSENTLQKLKSVMENQK